MPHGFAKVLLLVGVLIAGTACACRWHPKIKDWNQCFVAIVFVFYYELMALDPEIYKNSRRFVFKLPTYMTRVLRK